MLSIDVRTAIARDLGILEQQFEVRPLSGSALNQCWMLRSESGSFFVKTNDPERFTMLEAEADGLTELSVCSELAIPAVHAVGVTADTAWLVLDWLELSHSDERSNERLGYGLASLHGHTSSQYGWKRDNTIGLTPQINTPGSHWWAFFRDQRLGVQKNLLIDKAVAVSKLKLLDDVINRAEAIFEQNIPSASLLHGDLWGGNWATLQDGRPCIFDPAVYYGDAETDIAMTQLFGGFGQKFYAAYREVRPDVDEGPARRELYRLYHLLNHWNLFGSSYASQSQRSMKTLLQMI